MRANKRKWIRLKKNIQIFREKKKKKFTKWQSLGVVVLVIYHYSGLYVQS